MPDGELPDWHPQRMCSPIAAKGKFFAGDLEISKDMFEILKISSGRLTVAEAAAHCGLGIEEFMEKAKFLEKNLALSF